jgi:hypothetical protein
MAPAPGTIGSMSWWAGSTLCLHGSQIPSASQTEYTLILDVHSGAPLLYYIPETGEGACDLGGAFTTAPVADQCPAFRAMVAPDTSACVPGTCN